MHRIFAGMAIWGTLMMFAQVVLGVLTARLSPGPDGFDHRFLGAHMAFGVVLGIYLSVLHVMVMFHFIGSGKEMKEAAALLGEKADLLQKLRRLKMQVMPSATFAPLLYGAGVILGGGAHTTALGGWAWIHWGLGAAGMLLNFYAFPIEYRCLVANLELLKEVDDRVRREIAPGLYHE
jgi:hypothetical protein